MKKDEHQCLNAALFSPLYLFLHLEQRQVFLIGDRSAVKPKKLLFLPAPLCPELLAIYIALHHVEADPGNPLPLQRRNSGINQSGTNPLSPVTIPNHSMIDVPPPPVMSAEDGAHHG